MKRMLTYIVLGLVALILLLLIIGFGRTWYVNHSADQARFTAGTLPNPLPEGLYKGSVAGPKVAWLGKQFNTADSTGINLFSDGKGGTYERYSFVSSVSKGLLDPNTSVVAIDYNIPSNPFWLRPVRDEIVQIAPSHYLGKLNVRILPGVTFTLVFFELEK
jgi:hypothetical protein